MGAYLSRPVTTTEPEDGEGNRLQYGASSMQGWRITQEDAHNCLAKFDEDSSLFAVYDGHGGAEVALYLALHFPDLLKNSEKYKAGEWKEALEEAYLKMDASIKTPEVLAEVVRLSKLGKAEDLEEGGEDENVNELYEEATMPIDMLLAKYNKALQTARRSAEENDSNEDAVEATPEDEEKPGSSKAVSSTTSPEEHTKEEPSSSGSSSSSSGYSSKPQLEADTTKDTDEKTEETAVLVPEELKQGNGTVPKEENEAEPVKVNGTSHETEEPVEPKEVKLNGIDTKDGESEEQVESKEVSVIINGSGSEEDHREDSILLDPSTAKPRKAKVQIPPVLQVPTPVSPSRTSPRLNSDKIYKEFVTAETTSSDSEDEEEPSLLQRMALALGHSPAADDDDSDSEATDDDMEVNSSSTEDDDEEGDEEEDEDESEDDLALNDVQEPGFDSGATAVMAFSKWEGDRLHLWVANAGDSRCVVCRDGVALEMSQDHKPEEEIEARRIIAAGGKVTSEGRVNGGLNLSRAIGDHSYKQNTTLPLKDQMITSLPDIEYALLNPETDRFLVLACDGIWNSMTSQQVINFVDDRIKNPELKLSDICEQLFRACLSPDTLGDGTGCDNMTAIIVRIVGSEGGKADGTTQNEFIETTVSSGTKRSLDGGAVGDLEPFEAKRARVDEEEVVVAE